MNRQWLPFNNPSSSVSWGSNDYCYIDAVELQYNIKDKTNRSVARIFFSSYTARTYIRNIKRDRNVRTHIFLVSLSRIDCLRTADGRTRAHTHKHKQTNTQTHIHTRPRSCILLFLHFNRQLWYLLNAINRFWRRFSSKRVSPLQFFSFFLTNGRTVDRSIERKINMKPRRRRFYPCYFRGEHRSILDMFIIIIIIHLYSSRSFDTRLEHQFSRRFFSCGSRKMAVKVCRCDSTIGRREELDETCLLISRKRVRTFRSSVDDPASAVSRVF